MVEISSFPEVPVSVNGQEAASQPDAAGRQGAYLDVERGIFITSKGDEIELSDKYISALMIDRMRSEGKPKIPMREVTLLGKHKQMEANPNDPGYLALVQEWSEEVGRRLMRYMCNVGVKGQPPAEFIDEHREYFPSATDSDWKYLWVTSRLPVEDFDLFGDALIGRSIPTAKGIDEASNFTKSK